MSYRFENITVLVIENSYAMFELTRSVLKSFGVRKIYSAYTHDQGIKAARQLKPDLIIVDWLEEPTTGLSLTKKIRSDPQSHNPFVPIILMTGYSLKKRVLMARDAGITTIVVKPYTALALYRRIEELIEHPRRFVKNSEFFGPDRRHARGASYPGLERRSDAAV